MTVRESDDTLIERALTVRAALLADPDTDAVRVFHGRPDGLEGLVVEKLGPVCVAQLHEDRLARPERQVRDLVHALHERLGTRAVYRKRFVRDRAAAPADVAASHRDPQPWIGQPVEEEVLVREADLRFAVRPYDGFSVGLFLEHRDNRRRVRAMAAGRRVLNAFSYTGGFSVAAAAGGAASVASVDLSKRYLEWSKRNFAANGLDLAPHRFYCSDIFSFYRRARRQKHRYDLVILDPPTFSRLPHSRNVFSLEKDLDALVAGAVELLEPGGMILLATNDRGIACDRLETALRHTPRRCTICDRPPLPLDFPGDPDYAKTVLARYESDRNGEHV